VGREKREKKRREDWSEEMQIEQKHTLKGERDEREERREEERGKKKEKKNVR